MWSAKSGYVAKFAFQLSVLEMASLLQCPKLVKGAGGVSAQCGRTIHDRNSLCRHVQLAHQLSENQYECIISDCRSSPIAQSTNIFRHFVTHHQNIKGLEFLNEWEIVATKVVRKVQPHQQQSSSGPSSLALPQLDSDWQMDLDNEMSSSPPRPARDDDLDLDQTVVPKFESPRESRELRLEDKFCNLIVKQKKTMKTSQEAAMNMADQWLFILMVLRKVSSILLVQYYFWRF